MGYPSLFSFSFSPIMLEMKKHDLIFSVYSQAWNPRPSIQCSFLSIEPMTLYSMPFYQDPNPSLDMFIQSTPHHKTHDPRFNVHSS